MKIKIALKELVILMVGREGIPSRTHLHALLLLLEHAGMIRRKGNRVEVVSPPPTEHDR